MKLNNYCVLDIETTGLSYINNEIIEIGILKVRKNEIIDSFNQLVKPKYNIPREITDITHIDNKMVENAPNINSVLFKMLEFIEDLPLIIHNAPFDISFLEYNLNKLGITMKNEVIDTLKLSRAIYRNFEKHSLQYLAEKLNIEVNNAHRALEDTKTLFEVFKKIENSISYKMSISQVNEV